MRDTAAGPIPALTRLLPTVAEPVVGDCDFGLVAADGTLLARRTWRLLAASQDVADSVVSALGTVAQPGPESGTKSFEVVVERDVLNVVVEHPNRLTAQMKLWNSRGLAHHCDGRVFLSPASGVGRSCGCPADIAERRERARLGLGPQPVTTLFFRLAAGPGIGVFQFRSSSWRFFEEAEAIHAQLVTIGRPALCDLTVVSVEFTSRTDRRVSYDRPTVKALGPWDPRTAMALAA